MKTVFFVDDFGVQEGIPREFHGVPFVINEDGEAESYINEYLLARRNGDWDKNLRANRSAPELLGRTAFRANLTYLRNRVYHLDVLRRWLVQEGMSFAAVQNAELDQFAEDLEEGLVTGCEGGLKSSTVNQYLVSAIDFLRYGSFVGWREPLVLSLSKTRAGGQWMSRPLVLRRVNPAELTVWYNETQIEEFLAQFDSAPMRLAARIMYATGLRISEALSLTVSQFPSPEEARRDPARRRIQVTGKFGKTRWVPIELDLLARIERFVSFERKVYARKCKQQTDLLLIAPKDGGSAGPVRARAVQKAFVTARKLAGYDALSPHLLRHHFAAHYLIRAWEKKRTGPHGETPWVDTTVANSLLSTELLILKEALGHESFDTTMKYLHAISFLMGSSLPEQYSSSIDPEDEN